MRCSLLLCAPLALMGCDGVSKNPVDIDAAIDSPIDSPDDGAIQLTAHRYIIDKQLIPTNNTQARDFGLDLDGDAVVDNQLGMVMGTLAGQGFEVQTPVATSVDRGEILLLAELGANGFVSGPVSFTLFSGADPQPPPCNGAGDTICRHHLAGTGSFTVAAGSAHDMPLTGALVGGIATTDVGSGHLQLVTNLGGGRVVLNLLGARAKLSAISDATVANGVIAGAVTRTEIDTKLLPAWQMSFDAAVARDCPGAAPTCSCISGSQGQTLQQLFDTTPRDCSISLTELMNNSLIQSLLAPDVTIDGQQALSLGIGVTAVKAAFTP
ncbi:MAG TPA: hypothetical protein VFQ53_19845 [Kofleriaceae bacterium]|nr:hypothetical protein [Kofleriaceae bacterium]